MSDNCQCGDEVCGKCGGVENDGSCEGHMSNDKATARPCSFLELDGHNVCREHGQYEIVCLKDERDALTAELDQLHVIADDALERCASLRLSNETLRAALEGVVEPLRLLAGTKLGAVKLKVALDKLHGIDLEEIRAALGGGKQPKNVPPQVS